MEFSGIIGENVGILATIDGPALEARAEFPPCGDGGAKLSTPLEHLVSMEGYRWPLL